MYASPPRALLLALTRLASPHFIMCILSLTGVTKVPRLSPALHGNTSGHRHIGVVRSLRGQRLPHGGLRSPHGSHGSHPPEMLPHSQRITTAVTTQRRRRCGERTEQGRLLFLGQRATTAVTGAVRRNADVFLQCISRSSGSFPANPGLSYSTRGSILVRSPSHF